MQPEQPLERRLRQSREPTPARREFVKMERLVPDAEFAPFEKAAAE